MPALRSGRRANVGLASRQHDAEVPLPSRSQRNRLARLGVSLLGLLSVLVAGACRVDPAGREAGGNGTLVVLAAASMADPLRELGTAHARTHPNARPIFSFAGSQVLAAQLRAGVQADVIATANPAIMGALAREGRVIDPVVFATNRMVWIVRRDPRLRAVPRDLDTLVRSDLRLVLAAPEVPAGRYARRSLARLGLLRAVESRLVSQELDVKGVVAKVRLAGADAGAVYATDVRPSWHEELAVLELPDAGQVEVRYVIAGVRDSRRPAEAAGFVAWVRSGPGHAVLRRHGFGTP
ncbi:MAG: molybdate ABC transporter substrate-binding protein [Myxococcota bacterium]